jgi:hypothetical protein
MRASGVFFLVRAGRARRGLKAPFFLLSPARRPRLVEDPRGSSRTRSPAPTKAMERRKEPLERPRLVGDFVPTKAIGGGGGGSHIAKVIGQVIGQARPRSYVCCTASPRPSLPPSVSRRPCYPLAPLLRPLLGSFGISFHASSPSPVSLPLPRPPPAHRTRQARARDDPLTPGTR